MKFRKRRTLVFVFSLIVLALSFAVRYSAAWLGGFVSESPITPFVEEHIIHRQLNPETLVRNWGNLIKKMAGTGTLFALFLLFMTREKWLPFIKVIGRRLKELITNQNLTVIEKRLSNKLFLFLFCGFLGAAFFVTTFGVQILDVTYTDWLMAGGDLSQHYLGWRMFRQSAWHFPIGLMDNIVYPFKESVVYTDSIPFLPFFSNCFRPSCRKTFSILASSVCWFISCRERRPRLLFKNSVKTAFLRLQAPCFLFFPPQ